MAAVMFLVAGVASVAASGLAGCERVAGRRGVAANTAVADRASEPIVLLAASNLGPAAREVAALWTQHTGQPVDVSVAGTNVLANQLLAGLSADVLIAADEAWMDELADRGRVVDVRPLAGNAMVVVVPADGVDASGEPRAAASATDVDHVDGADGVDNAHDAQDAIAALAGDHVRRVGLAGPSVPAGRYAEAMLRAAGVFETLEVKNAIVRGPNVRTVLRYVASGAVDAGVVYASDARGESRVRVVAVGPTIPGPPIIMPSALVRTAADRSAAREFHAFLHGPDAWRVFAAHGYRRPPGGSTP
ncbi:MAG: molybdate ABC transporter substrate-binding protein [Phycisphaerales bacterium]